MCGVVCCVYVWCGLCVCVGVCVCVWCGVVCVCLWCGVCVCVCLVGCVCVCVCVCEHLHVVSKFSNINERLKNMHYEKCTRIPENRQLTVAELQACIATELFAFRTQYCDI